MGNFGQKLDGYFRISERGSSVRTEFRASIATFLTSVSVIIAIPGMLQDTGMNYYGLFLATIIISGLTTLLMGLYANLPFALTPGFGLTAYFSFFIVGKMGIPWQSALCFVFISGCCFLLLSLFKIRRKITDAMPDVIKKCIGTGIGFFIAFIGLTHSGFIVLNAGSTALGDLKDPAVLLTLGGLLIMVLCVIRRVKGGILIGILAVTLAGFFIPNPQTGENFTAFSSLGFAAEPVLALSENAFEMDFRGLLSYFDSPLTGIIFIVFGFLFVDMFDTIAVLLGVTARMNIKKADGTIPGLERALQVDAAGTVASSFLGITTVTTLGAESSAGVMEGGRTGLTAVFVAILFLSCLILAPVFLMIPSVATAPVLILIGVFMMGSISGIDLTDPSKALPVFMAVFITPLTGSIANGIMFAIMAYVAVEVFKEPKKAFRNISPVIWILFVLFVISIVLN